MSVTVGDAERGASDTHSDPGIHSGQAMLSRRTMMLTGGGILLLALLLAYGWHWYTVGRFFMNTDDAFLSADTVTVAPRVAGYVTEIDVADNQAVRAGAVLARVDDRDYRAVLAQGQAEAAQARAGIAAAAAQITEQQSQIEQAEADVESEQAQLRFAALEQQRARNLSQTGAGTVQSTQRMEAQLNEMVAALKHGQAALAAAHGRVATLQATRLYVAANLSKAEADIARAQLNLDDTVLRAPVDGVIGDRTLRRGNYVQPGLNLLTLVPMGAELYITANYKETQLGRIRIGQPAAITVDAFGGHVFHGHVDGLSPGTGSQFALLPPENATGNFTKIVQRVPMKIRLDGHDPWIAQLRAGLSATASIDTRGDAGPETGGQALPAPADPSQN